MHCFQTNPSQHPHEIKEEEEEEEIQAPCQRKGVYNIEVNDGLTYIHFILVNSCSRLYLLVNVTDKRLRNARNTTTLKDSFVAHTELCIYIFYAGYSLLFL